MLFLILLPSWRHQTERLMLLYADASHRQMSLTKNVNAIPHHSQATSKSKRIWNIRFSIYCSGTPTWLCARVEPAQNRYSTRSPTPCRRLLMFASSYFWPPPSSYSKCAWKVFYDILKMLVLFFTKENSSLLTLKREQWIRMLCDNSSLQKLVKPKPLAGKMAPVKTQSWTSGWVSILWRNDLNAPWTYS